MTELLAFSMETKAVPADGDMYFGEYIISARPPAKGEWSGRTIVRFISSFDAVAAAHKLAIERMRTVGATS